MKLDKSTGSFPFAINIDRDIESHRTCTIGGRGRIISIQIHWHGVHCVLFGWVHHHHILYNWSGKSIWTHKRILRTARVRRTRNLPCELSELYGARAWSFFMFVFVIFIYLFFVSPPCPCHIFTKFVHFPSVCPVSPSFHVTIYWLCVGVCWLNARDSFRLTIFIDEVLFNIFIMVLCE